MKNNFSKKLVVFCLSTVMSLGLCLGISGLSPVGAASATKYDVAEVASTYAIGTQVTVSNVADPTSTVFPKEISIDSVTATANTLKYPDGYERLIGDSLVLNQLGEYTITYKAGADSYYFDTFLLYNLFFIASKVSSLI